MHILVLIVALALGIGALVWYHSQGISLPGSAQIQTIVR